MSQPSHIFDLQFDRPDVDRTLSTTGQISMRTDSSQQNSPSTPFVTPPLSDRGQRAYHNHMPPLDGSAMDMQLGLRKVPSRNTHNGTFLFDIERPISMLHPSRSLPIIDELARQQLLDLIDIIQPTAPDGSIVMRDHPLLSLSYMQQYCDLFFTRFNTAYPLIHMSTFDPSEVDTLLLISVLLLGSTYAEKDAHQLAVDSLTTLYRTSLIVTGLHSRRSSTTNIRERRILGET